MWLRREWSLEKPVEIAIKEDGKFLDVTHVPPVLKERAGIRNYVYRRHCYDNLIEDILASLPILTCKAVAILGTAGIGKSALFLVILNMLLKDPTKLGLATGSFYFQTRSYQIWLYYHQSGSSFSVRLVEAGEHLDESIILFADIETVNDAPKEHGGISLIFTSFSSPSHYKELTKNGWRKVLPTWSADEQWDFFSSNQFETEYSKEVAQRAYYNTQFFGGSIRNNIQAALAEEDPLRKLEHGLLTKGEFVCEHFFRGGFGDYSTAELDLLVHRNPEKMGDGRYDYNAERCAYSFASPYVMRRLAWLKDGMLAADARNKYCSGNYRGGDDESQA